MKRLISCGLLFCIVSSACTGGGDNKTSETATTSTNTVASVTGSVTVTSTLALSGSPSKTASVGNWYSFQPQLPPGSDGSQLSFTIENAPNWARFNSTTGELSGTPEQSNIGTFANIIISVTDGHSSASLTPYAISVTQAPGNTVTLTWVPPTQNTDGTPLTDLAGYHIYFGNGAESLDRVVQISDPKTDSYELANLPAGNWFFSVEAYSSEGSTSKASGIISVNL